MIPFLTPDDAARRLSLLPGLAAAVKSLGSNAGRSMRAEQWARYCDAAEAYAEASDPMMIANVHVDGATEFDVETVYVDPGYGRVRAETRRVNERTPFLRAVVSRRTLALATRHGCALRLRGVAGMPRWHSLGDRLRITGAAPFDPARTAADGAATLRGARRIPEHVVAWDVLDRSRAFGARRSSGLRTSSLRFAAAGIVSARHSGDELAAAILGAVETAGTWGILDFAPAHRVAPNRRADPPCDGLAQWIPEPFRAFARVAPASYIHAHVRRHLFEATDEDALVERVPSPIVSDPDSTRWTIDGPSRESLTPSQRDAREARERRQARANETPEERRARRLREWAFALERRQARIDARLRRHDAQARGVYFETAPLA